MCGIAGSITLKEAYELYLANLERGSFGSGFLAVGPDKKEVCLRTERVFDLQTLEEACKDFSPYYYLFHSRAPTNEDAQWSEFTTHPFYYEGWYAAHNGIISNVSTFLVDFPLMVDSQLIPYHAYQDQGKLENTFSRYEGLLTSWLYDKANGFLYLVKGGSTLYINFHSGAFSSNMFPGAEVVEDGNIWRFLGMWKHTKTFNYNNPYFL